MSSPIGVARSEIRVPSSLRKALCAGSKIVTLRDSICSRFSSSKVLKLISRHTVTELRDISRHRTTGKPGSQCWTEDLGAQWHTGFLSPAESLAVSMVKFLTPKIKKSFLTKRKKKLKIEKKIYLDVFARVQSGCGDRDNGAP